MILHYSIGGEPMFDRRASFLGYRGVGRDISERIRGERALRESERRIRALLRRLTADARSRAAPHRRDLHDFVGQNLTALGVALETLRVATGEAREIPNAPTFEEMAGLLRDTMDSVRQVMSDLRPPLLDDYGLVAALESHARHFASRTGLAVSVAGERIGAASGAERRARALSHRPGGACERVEARRSDIAQVVLASGPAFCGYRSRTTVRGSRSLPGRAPSIAAAGGCR
jgi:PAS domain-containing protein